MSTIKKLRTAQGFTQTELAEKTGLSLRTIQRIEAGNNKPKGHSLKALSKAFNLEPSVLQSSFQDPPEISDTEKQSLKFINLATLAFLGIPFGNLIVPFILWRKKKYSEKVDSIGRRIINFQIMWSLTLCIGLCIAPFIGIYSLSFPLTLLYLGLAVVINLIVFCKTALSIQREEYDLLNLPIQLI